MGPKIPEINVCCGRQLPKSDKACHELLCVGHIMHMSLQHRFLGSLRWYDQHFEVGMKGAAHVLGSPPTSITGILAAHDFHIPSIYRESFSIAATCTLDTVPSLWIRDAGFLGIRIDWQDTCSADLIDWCSLFLAFVSSEPGGPKN